MGPDELVAPDDPSRVKRVQQQGAQFRAVDLGSPAVVRTVGGGLVDEDGARLVHHPHALCLRPGEPAELLVQSRFAQGQLTGLDVQVEQAALPASVGSGVEFVDGAGDVVLLQDAGQHQPAEPAAHDGDGQGGRRGHVDTSKMRRR
jgi:hypothetical protein